MAGQLMGLSLFIMLLAFFIVLNAISTFSEQKARQAVASLGDVFGSEEEFISTIRGQVEETGKGDSLDSLEGLFNAYLTGIDIEQDKTWGTMHISLPLDEFVAALESVAPGELKAQGADLQGKPMLPTLVSLLESGEGKLPFRMDMIASVPEDPGRMYNDDPASLHEISEKLSSMAVRLEKGGLPASQMSIGVQRGQENNIDLYFRRLRQTAPQSTGK